MKHLKLLFLLLISFLAIACESDKGISLKSSFKKGNPYAKEFAGLNGPVEYAVYSHFKNGIVDKATRDDYSPEGVLTKRKTYLSGDSIVTYYIYDSNNNIQEIAGTGFVSYKNKYTKGNLVKEWFYTTKNKKKGYIYSYKIKGDDITKKEYDMITGAGTTITFSYNSNGLVCKKKQIFNDGKYTLSRYDRDGHPISIEHYNRKDSLLYKENISCKYDKNGNCILYVARVKGKLRKHYKVTYKYYTEEELLNAKKKAESTIVKSNFGEEDRADVATPSPWLMGGIVFFTLTFLVFYLTFAQKRWELFNHFGGQVEFDGMRKMWMYNTEPYLKMSIIFISCIAAFLSSIILLLTCGGVVWGVFWAISILLWIIVILGWILLIGGIISLLFKVFYGILAIIVGAVIIYYQSTLITCSENFTAWGSNVLDNVNALDWTVLIFTTYGKTILTIIAIPLGCFLALAILLIILSYMLRLVEFVTLKIYNVNRPCPYCGNTHGFVYMIGNQEYPIPLHPGVYGVLHQTNHDTGVRVPTMLLNGKAKLTRKCPVCERLINKEHDKTYGTDIHIGIVGTRSSGKSYLLYSGLELLSQDFGKDLQQIDTDKNNQMDMIVQRIHHNEGIQTAVLNRYKAIQFRLNRKHRPLPYHLFFYDVAGEKFNINAYKSKAALEFYSNVKTIVFVIDPTMTDVEKVVPSERFAEWLSKHENPNEKYDAEGTLGELKKILTQIGRKTKDVDIIITCTKKDLGYLEKSDYPYDLDEPTIKRFIGEELGLTNLLNSTSDFKSVGYAMVSAMDEERKDLHQLFLRMLKQRGFKID